jgi:hypothetical protein
MKKRYWLYFLFVILLIIAAVVLFNKRSGTYRGDENRFAVKDTARIVLIEIRSQKNTVILERMQGHWMINGKYSAGNRKIAGLLMLISRLQVSAPVPGSIHSEITEKLEKEGKRLLIVSERKNPHVIFMYYDTVYTNATCMMLEHSDQPYRVGVPGYPGRDLAGHFVDDAGYWRDNSIFRHREDEIGSVSMYIRLQPEKSFHLVNDIHDGWRLFTWSDSVEVPDLNTEQVAQYLGYFASVSFERFLSVEEIMNQEGLKNDDPANIIILTDSKNNVIKVETFPWLIHREDVPPETDLNRLIVVVNDTDVAVAKYVEIDPVMKEIGYFLEKEKNR